MLLASLVRGLEQGPGGLDRCEVATARLHRVGGRVLLLLLLLLMMMVLLLLLLLLLLLRLLVFLVFPLARGPTSRLSST